MVFIVFVSKVLIRLKALYYVSVQYNGGLLPNIILLAQRYYHRETRLNTTKRFCFAAYDPT